WVQNYTRIWSDFPQRLATIMTLVVAAIALGYAFLYWHGGSSFPQASLGEPQKALQAYQEVARRSEVTGNRKNLALALYHIGDIYRRSLDYKSALVSMSEAASLLDPSPRKASALTTVGDLHRELGDPYRAFAAFQK